VPSLKNIATRSAHRGSPFYLLLVLATRGLFHDLPVSDQAYLYLLVLRSHFAGVGGHDIRDSGFFA